MASNIIDLVNEGIGGTILAPISLAAGTTNGPFFDMLSDVGPLSLIVQLGVSSIATSINVKLQEAKEDPANLGNPLSSDWSDMQGAAIPQQTLGSQDIKLLCRFQAKRFIRPVIVLVGGGAIVMAVSVWGQHKIVNPSGGGSTNSPQV